MKNAIIVLTVGTIIEVILAFSVPMSKYKFIFFIAISSSFILDKAFLSNCLLFCNIFKSIFFIFSFIFNFSSFVFVIFILKIGIIFKIYLHAFLLLT